MNMIDIHYQAKNREIVVYNDFLRRYNIASNKLFGFVEGIEDPCFYRSAIQHLIPSEFDVDFWPVGNKDKLQKLYALFDWGTFPRDRIAFFMDCDLSKFLGVNLPNAQNIYTTDNYSIENDCVNRLVCHRTLTEIFNLSNVEKIEMDSIIDLFSEQLDVFHHEMVPIMSWIIYWERTGKDPSLDNINMDHLFDFVNGQIIMKNKPDRALNAEEYIHQRCFIYYDNNVDITNIITEFNDKDGPKKFIRGKYELWFLINFCNHIHQNIKTFSKTVTLPPKVHSTFSSPNALMMIAPRTVIPVSLRIFLNRTYLNYIKRQKRPFIKRLFQRFYFKRK